MSDPYSEGTSSSPPPSTSQANDHDQHHQPQAATLSSPSPPSPNSSTPMPTRPKSAADYREYLFKILVVGELGTGKTSFIKRYVHQYFSSHYRATVGVDFALKVITWDDYTLIRIQLWDIAGQERFTNMTRVYYKEAVGAFIVFDVTRPITLDAAIKWKRDLDSKICLPDGSAVPCLLLANKSDLDKEDVAQDPKALDAFCADYGFIGWYYVSAKTNLNVEQSSSHLIGEVLKQQRKMDHESYGEASGEEAAGIRLPGGGGQAAGHRGGSGGGSEGEGGGRRGFNCCS